jgi:hypothetical protein
MGFQLVLFSIIQGILMMQFNGTENVSSHAFLNNASQPCYRGGNLTHALKYVDAWSSIAENCTFRWKADDNYLYIYPTFVINNHYFFQLEVKYSTRFNATDDGTTPGVSIQQTISGPIIALIAVSCIVAAVALSMVIIYVAFKYCDRNKP